MAITYPKYIRSNAKFRSKASGNWNNYASWQIQAVDGSWVSSPYYPSSGNYVDIQPSHTITLVQNEQAASLNIRGALNSGSYSVSIAVCSEATAYQTNIVSAGGTLSGTKLDAVDYFIKTLKNAGIWPKIVDMGLYLGGTLNAALVKCKYPSTFSSSLNNGATSLVSGDYSDSTGITAAATGRKIDTQVIPTSNGLSNTNFYYCLGMLSTPNGNSANLMLDNQASGGATAYIGNTAIGMNGGGLQASVPAISSQTFLRSISSNGVANYYDGFCQQLIPLTTTPTVTMNTSVSIFGGKSFGSNSYGTGSLGFHCIASYLTQSEDATLKIAVRNLWQALGRKAATKEMVSFGDSIDFGTGATVYTNRWSYKLAQALSLVERNSGIGGSAFRVTGSILGGYDRRKDIYNYDFLSGGYVVVEYGVNDCRTDTGTGTVANMQDLQTKLTTFFNELIALGQPANKILVGGIPLLVESATPETRQDNYTTYIQAACTATGVTFVDLKTGMKVTGSGTISATSGSAAVTGVGTPFTLLAANDWININSVWYKVSSVTDDTHLTLSSNSGSTVSGASFIYTKMAYTDGVHPNDSGHQHISDAYYAAR